MNILSILLMSSLSVSTPNKPQLHKEPIKITVGMTKKEIVEALGQPNVVNRSIDLFNKPYLQIFYMGDMCLISGESCYVIIENDRVISWSSFKPEYQSL